MKNELVIKAIDYIVENLNEEITVEDVADYCHLSKYYFCRVFKAATGVVTGPAEAAISEDNPAWVKATMERLEQQFDQDTVVQIRRNCQCGYGMDEKLALLNELLVISTSLEEFGNHEKANAAGLFCDKGELYLQFPFCPCPMLEGVDRLESDTWCQCTTGYSKVLFEKAFLCQVEVELLKSIKMGDDKCLMKIRPEKDIWK